MCGICGIVELGAPPAEAVVARMSACLAHRGPDGDGLFAAEGVALGHRRLAIIDTSDAGHQPFASDDGLLQLIHNGEVYDYRELRARLEAKGHRFRSGTDTEVILRAYEEWGDACVERFNGMWAFALWDGRRQRLLCARDRFGVKPFLYRFDGRRFVFASEPAAFRADPATRLRPDLQAVRDFVALGATDHTDGTFFEGIRRLPAAHTLVLDASGLRLRRYWALEPRPVDGDPAEAFRETFLDAVRLRLRSDVPVGTALSGGLDSSAIAVAIDHLLRTEAESARPVGDRQRTFTAWFPDRGFDERPYAEAVASAIRSEPHWVTFSDADLVEVVPRVVECQGEPFGSTSIVAQWHVMRAAREAGVTVMLDGQGGDEVLAGYPTTFGYRFADLLAAGRLAALGRELAAYRRLHGASPAGAATALATPFLPAPLRQRLRERRLAGARLLGPAVAGLATTPEPRPRAGLPDRLRRQYSTILLDRGLPELLRYEDRNSMAHGIESRVPFLDYRLAELTYAVDGDELHRDGTTKRLLRRALGDLLPPLVRDRVDKLGFVTPEGRFLDGALGELAADVLRSRACADRGLIDPAAASTRLAEHRAGVRRAGFELWRALSVELWADAYLD